MTGAGAAASARNGRSSTGTPACVVFPAQPGVAVLPVVALASSAGVVVMTPWAVGSSPLPQSKAGASPDFLARHSPLAPRYFSLFTFPYSFFPALARHSSLVTVLGAFRGQKGTTRRPASRSALARSELRAAPANLSINTRRQGRS
jgi:hypothetical protein